MVGAPGGVSRDDPRPRSAAVADALRRHRSGGVRKRRSRSSGAARSAADGRSTGSAPIGRETSGSPLDRSPRQPTVRVSPAAVRPSPPRRRGRSPNDRRQPRSHAGWRRFRPARPLAAPRFSRCVGQPPAPHEYWALAIPTPIEKRSAETGLHGDGPEVERANRTTHCTRETTGRRPGRRAPPRWFGDHRSAISRDSSDNGDDHRVRSDLAGPVPATRAGPSTAPLEPRHLVRQASESGSEMVCSPASDPPSEQPVGQPVLLLRRAGEEVEVAPLVGLQDVVEVAARRTRGGSAGPARRRSASRRSISPRRARGRVGRASMSSAIMSPSRTAASGPPAHASGATCSTQVPKAVPAHPRVGDADHVAHAAPRAVAAGSAACPTRASPARPWVRRCGARARSPRRCRASGRRCARRRRRRLRTRPRGPVAEQRRVGRRDLQHRAAGRERCPRRTARPPAGLTGSDSGRSRARRGLAPRAPRRSSTRRS